MSVLIHLNNSKITSSFYEDVMLIWAFTREMDKEKKAFLL